MPLPNATAKPVTTGSTNRLPNEDTGVNRTVTVTTTRVQPTGTPSSSSYTGQPSPNYPGTSPAGAFLPGALVSLARPPEGDANAGELLGLRAQDRAKPNDTRIRQLQDDLIRLGYLPSSYQATEETPGRPPRAIEPNYGTFVDAATTTALRQLCVDYQLGVDGSRVTEAMVQVLKDPRFAPSPELRGVAGRHPELGRPASPLQVENGVRYQLFDNGRIQLANGYAQAFDKNGQALGEARRLGTSSSVDEANRAFVNQEGNTAFYVSPDPKNPHPFGFNDCGPTSGVVVSGALGLLTTPRPEEAHQAIDQMRDAMLARDTRMSETMGKLAIARGLSVMGAATHELDVSKVAEYGAGLDDIVGALRRGNPVVLLGTPAGAIVNGQAGAGLVSLERKYRFEGNWWGNTPLATTIAGALRSRLDTIATGGEIIVNLDLDQKPPRALVLTSGLNLKPADEHRVFDAVQAELRAMLPADADAVVGLKAGSYYSAAAYGKVGADWTRDTGSQSSNSQIVERTSMDVLMKTANAELITWAKRMNDEVDATNGERDYLDFAKSGRFGHYVALVGMTDDGMFLVADPLSRDGVVAVSAQEVGSFLKGWEATDPRAALEVMSFSAQLDALRTAADPLARLGELVTGSYFSIAQIGQVLDVFDTGQDKLAALRLFVGRAIDKPNAQQLLCHFDTRADRTAAGRIMPP